jgi:RimJ/RimL family protein N-acetyltransferase
VTVALHGARISLRPLRAEELEPVIEATRRWITDGTDESVLRKRVRERIDRSGEMTPHGLELGIEADGRLVGDVQARRDSLPTGVFELGIGLFEEDDRGKGYGREAVALLSGYLFESCAAHRIQLSTDIANLPMRRVVEALGFRLEGIMRGFWPELDGPHDYAIYGLTRNDYEDVKTGWISTS